MTTDTASSQRFLEIYNGRLVGIRQWEQLKSLWQAVAKDTAVNWYVYQPGQPVPKQPVAAGLLSQVLDELFALLQHDHGESYCGIVYADDLRQPTLFKVYDPNNLSASCGSSGRTIVPGWILIRIPPLEAPLSAPIANNRKRWWARFF